MSGMELVADGFRLIEGPVWDPMLGLVFADAEGGGVHAVRDGAVQTVLEHRRGIGGMVRHVAGGLVVSGRNLAYKSPGEPTVVLLDNDAAWTGLAGFSDIAADPAGRVLAGMLGSRPDREGRSAEPGCLWMVDLDGAARCLIPVPQVLHTNGLGFSPDGGTLYYADSGHRAVFAFDYTLDTGELSGRRLFASTPDGVPDGLAIAADGSVWIAEAFGSAVLVFGPDGRLRRRITMPRELVTNVAFGGPDLTDVYVTTGSLDPAERLGGVYRLTSDVPGTPVPQARCPLGGPVPAIPPIATTGALS
jgi:sugar lactone lactonase YvrE